MIGPGLRGQPRVRGEAARRTRRRSGSLRDLQYGQALDYPAIQVERQPPAGRTARRHRRSGRPVVRRRHVVEPLRRAELLGRSPDGHRLPGAGPGAAAAHDDARRSARRAGDGGRRRRKPLLGDLARIENATIVGEYDRVNGQRMVTLTANVAGEDLGRAAAQRARRRSRAPGTPPRGATVTVRGQIAAMRETFTQHHRGPASSRSWSSSCCSPRTSSRCGSRWSSSRRCRPCWPASS